jgi:hypothetical protein
MVICAKCGKALSPEQAGSPCPDCGSLDRQQCATDGALARDQVILRAKQAAARELAMKHYEVEDGLMRIFRLTGKAEVEASRTEPIKLLEVNENTVPSGVMPLHFGPVPAIGIPFPSIIVEVTPDEFAKIKTHELKLPNDWEFGEEVPKTADGKGGA